MKRYTILSQGKRQSIHWHAHPGFIRRWLRGLGSGARIKCECGKVLELRYDDPDYVWVEVD